MIPGDIYLWTAIKFSADMLVDSALSTTSENPVQNKVVKAALDAKQDRECWERTLEIDKEYKILQEKLREYLKTLDVVDEK